MRNLFFTLILLFAIAAGLQAQYPNVMISSENTPNEPSICINPKNPLQMVAGSNTENYYYSSDGGLTWNHGVLTSSYGVWGDPVVIADTAGSFYFFHLSVPSWGSAWLDRIVCQKSVNCGQTWNDGSYMGLNGLKDEDKEWAVVNPANNAIYTCWTQFDAYGSASPYDSSNIMFSRSSDGGGTWSPAKRINSRAGDCLDMDNTVEGAVPATGPNGEIYVSWAGPLGLVFTKSTDEGETWADNLVAGDIPGGWDFGVAGIYRANGLPVTCCDLSNGPYHGTIYINWSDQRNGENDTDIWIIKSTDGGTSWSSPKRVNDDPAGHQQFFTWMAVDQVTGIIYTVFYDRRNHNDNLTDVFMAVSKDGGETFNNFKISETPFNPDPAIFFGDYTCIVAHNNIVRPIWTRLHNGTLSVMTALADSIFTGVSPEKEKIVPFSLEQNYPNPVHGITYFSYKVHAPASVSLKVYDIYGHQVATILSNVPVSPGKHIEQFDCRESGLAPGLYYFSLISDEMSVKRKMVVQ
ncbi:MAG: T9SS type A sorting domain-containing protein [Bacteroidetes bacterium]|nr:T9SS type A sorting domain-containing protein [Bacteroidota bacterium]